MGEHWEPKEKNRTPPREAPLRRRRETAAAKEEKTATKRRTAAPERRSARSPSSRKEQSSSEEPAPKKRAAKNLPSSSASEEPPSRKASSGLVKRTARNKADTSPDVPVRTAKVAKSPEAARALPRDRATVAPAARSRAPGGGPQDLLRRVLQANRPQGGPSRTAGVARATKEPPPSEPEPPSPI